MPPQTRTRVTKVLKENINFVKKSKVKSKGKITKPPRKALADKTNSLSDDNASIDVPIKTSKKPLNSKNTNPNGNDKVRPRRERRLPPRYVENQLLKNLSNSKDSPVKQNSVTSKNEPPTNTSVKEILMKTTKDLIKQGTNLVSTSKVPKTKAVSKFEKSKNTDNQVLITKFVTKSKTRPRRNGPIQPEVEYPIRDDLNVSSPFKTPQKSSENSSFTYRPKRVCRLPSRFEDHSISPNKFIPVQPCHASTPIPHKTTKVVSKITQNVSIEKENYVENKLSNKPISKAKKSKPTKTANKAHTSNSSIDKSSPDTNNNGKDKVLRPKKATVNTKLQTKQVSPSNKIKPFAKRLLDKSLSFRVLEDKKSNKKGLDVYEFTFDPNDEPPPQKKKRKKPVKKRPAKPKTVLLKSNYNENVSKALANLKNKVKPSQTKPEQCNVKPTENLEMPTENHVKPMENHLKLTENVKPLAVENAQGTLPATSDDVPQSNYSANIAPPLPINDSVNSIHASNYASIRVEDIAADFEFSDRHDDINYSPVHSPQHQPTPEHPEVIAETPEPKKSIDKIDPVNNIDPLNLQEDVSFFGEPPVASSSMNVSVRHPLASPWRVEFGSLPMKWHSNTYVKPNMTPAVESSFVNSEVTKKHVYTNMIPDNEPLPEIFETAPALKQTSIISFIKEVAERKANKKKRRRSQTTAIYEDVTGTSNEAYKSPKKAKITKDSTPNTSNNTDTPKDKENSSNTSNQTVSPVKKKKDKDCTYFGFDESNSIDQENVSPVKVNPNPKTRALRSRNVLQELNTQPMPTRAAMPVSAKAKLTSSEVVEQLYNQLKTAENAQFPEKDTAKELVDNTIASNVDDPSWCEEHEDSQSVHLFEDIEVVHHLKLHRKSYGKAKKVTFQRSADSNSVSPTQVRNDPDSSDNDDLADLSFHLPEVKQTNKAKKRKPKKQLTKKEEKEVEEWAAGFNSMCEDIDEFPLQVE